MYPAKVQAADSDHGHGEKEGKEFTLVAKQSGQAP